MQERAPLLYACEFDNGGYAIAARRYLQALAAVREPVEWLPLVNAHQGRIPTNGAVDAPQSMLELRATTRGHDTLLAHSMPRSWGLIRNALGPRRFIGQTVWEADPIPQRWHHELSAADEIWVPTQWNADTFRRSGITSPIHVIPHPVDATAASTRPNEHHGRFTFLTVSTWEWRKRPDLVVHAFLRAFNAADPVTLVVKTGPRVLSWRYNNAIEQNSWWQVMNIVRQYPQAADVVLISDQLTDAEMADLIQSADCFVSLTSVEGWGLGAFDAAVAGVPLIMTGYGGQLEWLGKDHTGLVPFTLLPADHPDTSMFEPGMTWALADVDAAADLMRNAVHGSPQFVADAPVLAARLRASYSHAALGALMHEALK